MFGGILQVGGQLFGHIATALLTLGKRSDVLGNAKLKILTFGFFHQENRTFVLGAGVWSIPVDDGARDAAADHVGDLSSHLLAVIGAVSDVAMVGVSKPRH